MKVEPVVLEGKFVRLEPLRLDHLPELCKAGLHQELWKWTTANITDENDMERYVRDRNPEWWAREQQRQAEAASRAAARDTTRRAPPQGAAPPPCVPRATTTPELNESSAIEGMIMKAWTREPVR